MAAPQNFRTAFNGFNREDVVHYLEYINTKHTTQVNQLTSEVESLRSQLETLRSQPSQDLQSTVDDLREECASLAAIPKSPTYYNPYRNPENNEIRRNTEG